MTGGGSSLWRPPHWLYLPAAPTSFASKPTRVAEWTFHFAVDIPEARPSVRWSVSQMYPWYASEAHLPKRFTKSPFPLVAA